MKNNAFLCACLIFTGSASLTNAQMSLLSNFSANQAGGFSAGEIAAFDKVTDRLFVTSSGSDVYRVNIFDMANPSSVTAVGTIDYSTSFGAATNMLGLSSVAVDPLSRFGVAALIPTNSTTTVGKVGFFDLSTGTSLGTLDVGYHPDSLTFSADGAKLIVVNEGEFKPGTANAPGSISVIDVSGINSGNLASLTSLSPVTRDFSAPNLGAGVTLSGVRNSNIAAVGTSGTFIGAVPDFTNPVNIDHNAIEPEYASVIGNKVYVSLQDNNAIAEYDLDTHQWTDVSKLGTIEKLIDASDDAAVVSISQLVKGMPMPDTVGTYKVGTKTYVVSANEGDARVDDRDISRFGDIAGGDSMNPIIDTDSPSNFPTTQTGVRANAALGRLNISRLDGDTDADGKIDTPTALGTRSFSIWEKTETGLVLVYDSGSFFETYIRDNDLAGWVDGRSDDKGPEPEGMVLGVIDDQTYAFISMERTNGIFMFNITDPDAPSFVDFKRISVGNIPQRPEGMAFVSGVDSPTGQPLLIVGFEGDGTAITEQIAVFALVPEPSTYALIGIAALGFALIGIRKRSDDCQKA